MSSVGDKDFAEFKDKTRKLQAKIALLTQLLKRKDTTQCQLKQAFLTLAEHAAKQGRRGQKSISAAAKRPNPRYGSNPRDHPSDITGKQTPSSVINLQIDVGKAQS